MNHSNDFEVLPIGSITEIKLSRELMAQIDQAMTQWGAGIVPHNILTAYEKLRQHHAKFVETV